MEKMKYTTLDMEIVFFDNEDVITYSKEVLADAGSALQQTDNLGNVVY